MQDPSGESLGTISPDQWSRVKAIFRDARECPPGQRMAFIEHACNGDRRMLRMVRWLLENDGSVCHFDDVAMAARAARESASFSFDIYRT